MLVRKRVQDRCPGHLRKPGHFSQRGKDAEQTAKGSGCLVPAEAGRGLHAHDRRTPAPAVTLTCENLYTRPGDPPLAAPRLLLL